MENISSGNIIRFPISRGYILFHKNESIKNVTLRAMVRFKICSHKVKYFEYVFSCEILDLNEKNFQTNPCELFLNLKFSNI